MTNNNLNAIVTDNLTRTFASGRAVDNLRLSIPQGIVFGFLGPNGAGKTTTIRLLLGLIEPTDGSAEVLGYDIRSQSEAVREETGALLEHTGLYERLTAEDNLEFFGRVNRMPQSERSDRIKELLTRFGLYERRSDRVGSWSRGMKQKLAVARAMLHRPSLLFLDEPTAGLDPVAAAGLRDTLASLVDEDGLTVFLTTHNLNEAEKLCSLVGVINKGKLISVGPPDNLRSAGDTIPVHITASGLTDRLLHTIRHHAGVSACIQTDNGCRLDISKDSSLAPIVTLLVQSGACVEEVRKEKASLEESFLKLMESENQ